MSAKLCTKITIILPLLICASAIAEAPDVPYFGLTPPGATPEVFAPGIISLPSRCEYDICLAQDAGEYYFSVRSANWSNARIMVTKYEDGDWTTPAMASFSNTYSISPSLADNDQTIYFSRNTDIWKATRTTGDWSAPAQMGSPVSSAQDEWSCRISDLGNLWICSWRPGGAGQCDPWRVEYEEPNFTEATNLSAVGTTYNDCAPVPGPNEEYVVFNSNRPGGYGAMDLYISFSDGEGGWTTPQNLGPTINTSMADVTPYISPDNKYLFFSRQLSSTDTDIYWVSLCSILPPTLPDLTCDGIVDINDLDVFTDYWLSTDQPSLDIAPAGAPDGVVNFLEFAIFAEYWLYAME